MDEQSKERYRRLRNGIGWALVAIWLIYRWTSLSAQNAAAKAAITKCDGLISSIGCTAQKSSEDLGFGVGMLFTLVLAPFAFLASHYVARFMVDKENADSARLSAELTARRQREEEAQQRARIENANAGASQARTSANRAEFVRSLGSVNDFLDLLSTSSGQDQELRAKQAIGKELRDLVAKQTLEDLAALIGSDPALRMSLESTLARLDEARVTADVVPVLRRASVGA